MATAETMTKKVKCPTLEITKQDFFQEAKSLIAQHYEKMNENKVQSTSINVFKNKHQKPKSGKYIPFGIKKKDIINVVQEHQTALKNIYPPKELSKSEHFEEPSQRTCFKEPHLFSMKEKCKPIDIIMKEQFQLGKIMTNIESVSKKMEKEKQQLPGKSRILESLYPFPIHPGLPLRPGTSSMGYLKEADKALYDWRGVVSTRSSRFARDLSRISSSRSSSIFQNYCTKTLVKKEQQREKPDSKPQSRTKYILSKNAKLDDKVKRIGPHIEIFQVFRERNKFIITKRVIRMITILQAYVRGWLERKRFQRIMTKALYHGPNLNAVIDMYRRVIHRVRYRLGLWRTRQIINLSELEEWMDRKKFYETMFAKREDWQELERSELLKYFNECGHFPTQAQIDDAWNLVHKDKQEKYSEQIKKFSAIEMLFTLYPPQGAQVRNSRLRSTWLRPIVNGEEGYKYIVNGHPILKRANIRVVGRLVSKSIRERKMRQYYNSEEME
ncbi:IQ domain-containing protein M [Tupaia chinensis]|uniref:IQ domain-containing protein M n=1 Tax=Tupaia chinensis TaxID=246437 RepID=UPI0003C8ECA2|nr:IQ domain-containing protein M [Tupaia chinensis]